MENEVCLCKNTMMMWLVNEMIRSISEAKETFHMNSVLVITIIHTTYIVYSVYHVTFSVLLNRTFYTDLMNCIDSMLTLNTMIHSKCIGYRSLPCLNHLVHSLLNATIE